jgi:hypothetical protein
MNFAKLYDTELGQILVKLEDEDEGLEVRYYFVPEGLGLCSVAVKFEGDDNWEKAEKYFKAVTKEKSIEVAKEVIDIFPT